MFYSFEGGEGAGKSTVIQEVAKQLTGMGNRTVITREPGGTLYAEEIRRMIMSFTNLDVRTESLLFAASRSDHIEKNIRPALRSGNIVLCDRFVDSSYVYQAIVGRARLENIVNLNLYATEGLLPKKTFFFDIAPKEALLRLHDRGEKNRFDEKDLAYHEEVYQAYQKLYKMYPERIVRVDATRSVQGITDTIVDMILGGNKYD